MEVPDLSEKDFITNNLSSSDENTMTKKERKEIAMRIIGTLANDIRNDWSDSVEYRYEMINDLLYEFDMPSAKKLGVSLKYAKQDGRYFRDWDGPYGGTVKESELELFGLSKENYSDFSYFEEE